MANSVWHLALKSEELEIGKIQELQLGTNFFCVLRRKDGIFAFAPQCPHAGGLFSEGCLDSKGNVECPLHQYRFNPANGYNVSGEGYHLKTYPIKEENGCIYLQF